MKNILLKKEILFDGNRALIMRMNDDSTPYEYVVCSNYDGSEWDWGHYFSDITEAVMYFHQYPTINPHRLSEIAGLLKDGLMDDDYDSAMEYFRDTLELTEEECEFFGIDYEEMTFCD